MTAWRPDESQEMRPLVQQSARQIQMITMALLGPFYGSQDEFVGTPHGTTGTQHSWMPGLLEICQLAWESPPRPCDLTRHGCTERLLTTSCKLCGAQIFSRVNRPALRSTADLGHHSAAAGSREKPIIATASSSGGVDTQVKSNLWVYGPRHDWTQE